VYNLQELDEHMPSRTQSQTSQLIMKPASQQYHFVQGEDGKLILVNPNIITGGTQ
jgi:hypothetical protein